MTSPRTMKTPMLAVAVVAACAWTACGGTGHLVFANADWHLRDAVLHDLVAAPAELAVSLSRSSGMRAATSPPLRSIAAANWSR